ncbi:MAG: hypothetical protein GY849_00985 [Deltaproteobacteria bacterium]|nr:hypothetical protein [Deltaproteobacteria bacterium]
MNQKKEFDYFDKPETHKKLWVMLYAVCALLLIPDFFTHRHADFGFEGFFGFYALLGFVSCAVLILFSKFVGLFLKAKEDYYDK